MSEITKLTELDRIRGERNDWRRKHFEMERAQSSVIDRIGELTARVMLRERELAERSSDKNAAIARAELAQAEIKRLHEMVAFIDQQYHEAMNRAELAEAKLAAEAWRAIETHPLDDAPVIIFCKRYGQVEAWFAAAEGQGEDRYGPFWIVCDDAVELEVEETPNGLDHHNVTHWKPLSPKPAVE